MAVPAQNPELDRAHPERMIYALVIMPILFFVGLAIGLFAGVRGDDLTELFLALVTIVIALVPLVIDLARRPSERHVMLSTFALVFIIGFALPVFVIFIPAEGPVDAPSYGYSLLMPVDVIRGQLATLLGLICLLAGYAIPIGRLDPILPKFRSDWPPNIAIAVATLMIPFGISVRVGVMVGIIKVAAIGTLSVLASSSLYGIALAMIAYLRHRSRFALLIVVVVSPIASLVALFTGSKLAMLFPWLMIALSIILVRRRIGARWVLLGILATTLVYPVGMFVRMDVLRGNTLSPLAAMRNPTATLGRISRFVSSSEPVEYFVSGLTSTVGRLDCIGAASVLIRDTPERVPFQNGWTIGLFFLAFIPRVIWPEKPIITIGQFFTDMYGSGPLIESSTAPTQLGEFYINFGYPGIIGGMLFYGVMLRFLHQVLLTPPTTPGLLAAVVVLLYLGTGFQGSIAGNWAITVMSVGPIIIAHFVVAMLFSSRHTPAPWGTHGGAPSPSSGNRPG